MHETTRELHQVAMLGGRDVNRYRVEQAWVVEDGIGYRCFPASGLVDYAQPIRATDIVTTLRGWGDLDGEAMVLEGGACLPIATARRIGLLMPEVAP